MCWNAEVSLESFKLGILAIVLAALSGVSFPALLFYASVTFMQFIEYVVWRWGIDDPDVNFGASLAAWGLLCLQPFALILSLDYPHNFVISYFVALLTCSIFQWKFGCKPMRDRYRMQPGLDGHLEWKWLEADTLSVLSLIIYMGFLFIPLVASKNNEVLFVLAVTLAVSVYSHMMQRTWGSMWCWIVNWMVVLVCIRAFVTASVRALL